jgi:queuine tRNA-ribosyltransferase
MKTFKYTLVATDNLARLGIIETAHGSFDTPVFMPVGTRGALKTMDIREAKSLGTNVMLSNTYHLYLKPGDKIIRKLGGLHKYANIDIPILTDSGGYQVFSMGFGSKKEKLVKIYEDRVEFRSHIDGSKHIFTPKSVLDIQNNLGSDIAMVLDECAPGNADMDYAREAMNRTHSWATEARDYAKKKEFEMAIFGIVQGGAYTELRNESAIYINSLDFDGNAIGGLAVGETKKQMGAALGAALKHLDMQKPRYLMGVGSPEDILEAVEQGVDMFDCVMPTRIARNGTVLTFKGRVNLHNSRYRVDANPIEEGCDCYACEKYSRAYIHHLINVGEILGIRLTTIHNLRFMMRFMEHIRKSIKAKKFTNFKRSFLKGYL